MSIRRKKFPNLKKVGTAGSFFKNPIITKQKLNFLKKTYPDMPSFTLEKGFVKVPLAWILDKVCELKERRLENVGLFLYQPLVFVNYGKGKQEELLKLKKEIENKVYKKTKIKIFPEVTFVYPHTKF